MGRKDLLVALFVLAALLAQQTELEARRPAIRFAAYGLGLLFTLLALGSKISAITLWAVLGLHRFLAPNVEGHRPEDRRLGWRPRLRRSAVAVLPHLALSLVVFWWYQRTLAEFGVFEPENPGALDPVHLRNLVKLMPLVAGEYLQHLLLPSELSIYYRWPHVAIPLAPAQIGVSLGIAAAILAAVVHCIRRRRDLAFYLLTTLALMAPYSGLFYVGFWHADRYAYLACFGVLTALAIPVRELALTRPHLRPVIALVAVLFVAMQTYATWNAQSRWRDAESLWTYEISRSEPAVLAFANLARHYAVRADQASPEGRRDLARRAKAVARQGIDRFASIGFVDVPYRIPERLQLARLHKVMGLADAALGAPPLVQAAHHLRAWNTVPDRSAALLISGALFQAALEGPDGADRPLIEESFAYFREYVELSAADPELLRESRILLAANYAGRFPYLEAGIDELERSLER